MLTGVTIPQQSLTKRVASGSVTLIISFSIYVGFTAGKLIGSGTLSLSCNARKLQLVCSVVTWTEIDIVTVY